MLSRPKIERGYKTGLLQGRKTLFPNVLPSTHHDSTKLCPSEQALGPNVVLSVCLPTRTPHSLPLPVRAPHLAQNSEMFGNSGTQQQLTLVIFLNSYF